MAQDLNRSIKIYIDNSDAMASSKKLEQSIASLRDELQKLAAEGRKDEKEYIAKEKALNKLEKSYGNYQNKIRETERVLKNLSGSTYRELRYKLKQYKHAPYLRQQLKQQLAYAKKEMKWKK